MKKKKKSRTKIDVIYIFMIIIAFIIILGTGVYAYYQSTITGTIEGSIAKWSFTANNKSESFNIDLGDLYPGKEETYYVELSAENSDLDIYYELIFEEINTSSNSYIRSSSGCDIVNPAGSVADICRGLYGTITAGSKVIIPLIYHWPYGGNDDLTEKEYDSINIFITARQLSKSQNDIPLKIYYNELNQLYGRTMNYVNGEIIDKWSSVGSL